MINLTALKKICFYAVLCLGLTLTQTSNAFVPGVDYQILDLTPIPTAMLANVKGHIKVVEFFSYGCPWCYKLDPALMQWQQTKPANVEFERVPVNFQPAWEMFSKVFYVAVDLNVENRLHQNLFTTVQSSYPEDPAAPKVFSLIAPADFSTDQGIRAYFITQGVKAADIDALLANPARLKQQMAAGLALSRAVKIAEIPSVIINGKYLVSNRYTGGDSKKFIATLNYLLK